LWKLSQLQSDTINALKDHECIAMEVASQELVVFNLHGQRFAFRNRCPHQNKKLLTDQSHCFDETFSLVECPLHGAQFLPSSGACVSGPCLGHKLERYQFIWQDDDLFLSRSEH
jgi:nitrite reductase/ring-hydroxylating ferredoxin subunit